MHQNKQASIASQELGYNGIYLERPGEKAGELVETLLAPPELPLEPEQVQEIYDFESSLATQAVDGTMTFEQIIRGAKGEDVVAPLYFAQPFIDGTIDSKGYRLPSFETEAEVYRAIALAVKNKTLSSEQLRDLAKKSAVAYGETVTSKLVAETEISQDDVRSRSIVLNPDEFLAYARQVRGARDILHEYRKAYKEGGERIDGAKRAVVAVYLSRINEILAQVIPRADYLIAQGALIGDVDTTNKGVLAIPISMRDAIQNFRTHKKILKQLDYLRNGISFDEDGLASSVSERLSQQDDSEDTSPEDLSGESMFSPEEKNRLQSFMLAPATMHQIFTNVLQRAGLLSSEDSSTWDPQRKVRASDGLFQVVYNPGQKTFAVDGISGVYKVATSERSLYDTLTVGGFHELTHVNQAQADRELGKLLRIAEIKGKRVSMIREAGANSEQRAAEKRYFGQAKPVALTYPAALKALESGEGMTGAIKAFYVEKCRTFPDMTAEKAAAEAADRVTRLIRQGGISSQSMVYAEEAILDDELEGASEAERSRASAVTGLDLVDQARLHKYGLLPQLNAESINWTELIMDEMRPYIQEALAADEPQIAEPSMV